jgi:hypothetical protein
MHIILPQSIPLSFSSCFHFNAHRYLLERSGSGIHLLPVYLVRCRFRAITLVEFCAPAQSFVLAFAWLCNKRSYFWNTASSIEATVLKEHLILPEHFEAM